MAIDGNEIARRLRQARDEAGINQQQAADAIGVHRTAITQMEAGNRAVSTLELRAWQSSTFSLSGSF